MFTVTVYFWAVLAAGWFTASFENKAFCEYWVQSNATPLHDAVSLEDFDKWRTTGAIEHLPKCVQSF